MTLRTILERAHVIENLAEERPTPQGTAGEAVRRPRISGERGSNYIEYALLSAILVGIVYLAQQQMKTATSLNYSKMQSAIGSF